MPRHESPPPRTSPNWSDPSCDTVIISSDNCAFFVPSYLLKAHSEVFRGMYDLPRPPFEPELTGSPSSIPSSAPDSQAEPIKIKLDDPIAEHSSSVLFFLSLISGKQLNDILRMFPLKMVLTFHAVLLFVKKWDCMLASNMMDMWLMELGRLKHSHREIKPLDVFIMAAKADKLHAAEHVVLRYKRGPVMKPIGWHWSILPEDKDFEPLNFEVSAWEDIPVPYLFALEKACKRHPASMPKDRAKAFKDAVDGARKNRVPKFGSRDESIMWEEDVIE